MAKELDEAIKSGHQLAAYLESEQADQKAENKFDALSRYFR